VKTSASSIQYTQHNCKPVTKTKRESSPNFEAVIEAAWTSDERDRDNISGDKLVKKLVRVD